MILSHTLILVSPDQSRTNLSITYGPIHERQDKLFICDVKFDNPNFSDAVIVGVDPVNCLRNAFLFFDEMIRNLESSKLEYSDGSLYESSAH
jgi:hypothetical protein